MIHNSWGEVLGPEGRRKGLRASLQAMLTNILLYSPWTEPSWGRPLPQHHAIGDQRQPAAIPFSVPERIQALPGRPKPRPPPAVSIAHCSSWRGLRGGSMTLGGLEGGHARFPCQPHPRDPGDVQFRSRFSTYWLWELSWALCPSAVK